MINYNAALPPLPFMGKSSINVNNWMGEIKGNLTYLVRSIFANNEQGFAYDPNDLTTLYQDAAGTIPVTAAGQPVGLMLDKSKGLVLGSNVATGFTSGFIPTDSVAADLANSPTDAISSNWFPVTPSAFYKIQAPISNRCRVQVKNASGAITYLTAYSSETSADARLVAASADSVFMRVYFANEVISSQVTTFEARKLTGNHAYQTVSASRPILQQTPILGNELVINGDFSNGTNGWGTSNCTQAVSGGENTITAVGVAYPSIYSDVACSVGKTYVITATCRKGSGASPVGIQVNGIAGVFTSSTTNVPMQYKFVATSSTHRVAFAINGATTNGDTATVDNISVKENTGYSTDQNYLAFDGADDFLQTNNIDFTATDKVSLFAGMRKLSDASAGIVCEFSINGSTQAGSFFIAAPSAASQSTIAVSSNGSGVAARYATTSNAPYGVNYVVSGKAHINAPFVSLAVNGVTVQTAAASQGGGNYGNHPLYIGRRAGSNTPFNGHLYSLVGIGRLSTDSETIALEKSIAKNTGVTLNA